jgi:replication factor A1
VKIENGYTRRGLAGEIELQAGSRSRIVASDKKLILPPIKTGEKLGISDLKPDSTSLSVEARVLRVYPPRAYSGGTLSSMIVGDKSGTIRVVLWDDKSGRVQEFARNDAVLIQNAYARANMNEEVEVHVGKYGGIKKIADSKVPKAEDIEMKYTQAKTIAELEPSEERVRISAKIVDLEERSIFYMTCPSCSGKVQNVGGAWFCDACGDVDPTPNLVVSAVLEDDSGTVRGVFFRESAEKILGLDAEAAMNLIGETQDEAAPLKEAKEKLRKNAVDLLGRGRYNDYSDQLEFIVDEFS